ncbi:MAG: hypothetical protein ACR2OZ_19895 [Verrucomicrobiales bacterium]
MAQSRSLELQRLRVLFGQEKTWLQEEPEGVTLALRVPHLAGPTSEEILCVSGSLSIPKPGSVTLDDGQWLAGILVRPMTCALDELTLNIYRDLLALTKDWSVCRIWNYVPYINTETTGLENYRRFNLGRWQAYRDAFGERLHQFLPAASAVGVRDDKLATVFVASRAGVSQIDNPEQVPAWRYPETYGPKAPSFARAAIAGDNGTRRGWVSGTASIKGHASVAAGDPLRQLDVTLDNLRLVLAQMNFPPLGDRSGSGSHRIKVYLRRRADLDAIRSRLCEQGMNGANGQGPLFLAADICRRELDVEIEVCANVGGTAEVGI